jgi:hypothetical protein
VPQGVDGAGELEPAIEPEELHRFARGAAIPEKIPSAKGAQDLAHIGT